MKKCTKCGVQKPLSEFQKRQDRPSGYQSSCKKCLNSARLAWGLSNKKHIQEYNRKAKLKINWGLTPEKFLEMQNKQNNVCEICKNPFKTSKDTHIDHCHKTGTIRGILCAHCNHALGKFKDSIEILKSAQKYLQKYSKKVV
jgi:hypothetical protein